jgi:hypothetical protein
MTNSALLDPKRPKETKLPLLNPNEILSPAASAYTELISELLMVIFTATARLTPVNALLSKSVVVTPVVFKIPIRGSVDRSEACIPVPNLK